MRSQRVTLGGIEVRVMLKREEVNGAIKDRKIMAVIGDKTSPSAIMGLNEGGVSIFERKFDGSIYWGVLADRIAYMTSHLREDVVVGAIGLTREEQYNALINLVNFQTLGSGARPCLVGKTIDYLFGPGDVFANNGEGVYKLFVPLGMSVADYLRQLSFFGDYKLIPMLRNSDDLRCIEAIFRAGAFAVEVGAECLSQYARNNDGVEGIFQEIETGRQRRQKDLEEAD